MASFRYAFLIDVYKRQVPEYSATVTGQGKEEDIGDKALLTESLDIFKTDVYKRQALAKGKKLYDKRQDIAKKDQRREAERDFKVRNLG